MVIFPTEVIPSSGVPSSILVMIKHLNQGNLQMEGFVSCSSGKEKYKTIISGEHGSRSSGMDGAEATVNP